MVSQDRRRPRRFSLGQGLWPGLQERRLQRLPQAAAPPGASLRVKGQIMATRYSQLAALPRSGVRLLRSLNVLLDQTSNKNLKTILEDVAHRVEDGTSLGDSMARYPRAFSEMAINMVRAGAEGGFLEDALE